MAKLWSQHFVNGGNLVTLKFRFQSAGGGTTAPDFVVGSAGISDVTQTSDGLFQITFEEKYPTFVGGFGVVMPATPVNDQLVKIDTADYDSDAGTLDIQVVGNLETAVAAEAVADNDWVYCELTFCRNSEQAPTVAI